MAGGLLTPATSQGNTPVDKRARKTTQPLACPLWKSNPSKYKDCFKCRSRGVGQLKKHLAQCHYISAYSCKSCAATFSREVDLREHFDASSKCIVRSDSFGPSGKGFAYSISTDDWGAINHVVRRRTMSPEERWEKIWHVLFPNRPRPPSPYAETDFSSGDLFLLCQHLTSTGSQELSDFFERKRVSGERITPATISKLLEGFCRDWAQRQHSITSADEGEPRSREFSAPSAENKLDEKASSLDEVKTVPLGDPIRYSNRWSDPIHSFPSIHNMYMGGGIGGDPWNASLAPSKQSADSGFMEHTTSRDASPTLWTAENSSSDRFVDGSVSTEPSFHSWSTATTIQPSYDPCHRGHFGLSSEILTYRTADYGFSYFPSSKELSMPYVQDLEDIEMCDIGEQIAGDSAQSNADSDAKSPALASGPTVVKESASSSPVSDNGRSNNENSPSTSQASSEGTGSFDIFEFGDIFVPNGSRFSSALPATVRALTVAFERESQIGITPHGMTGAASDPTDALEFSPPQNTPSDSAGSLASSGIHSLSTEITSQASSQRGDARQKRGREEDDEPKKSPLPKRKRTENGAKRLACPFQKRYPLKHFFCGAGGAKGETRGFVHISHIKSHIHRCHIRSLLYCPTCKEDFENPEDFAEHVREQSCETQPFRDETALPRTAALAASLRARVDKTQSLREQWFSVWRILFPGADEPRSCFMDDVPEHMIQYQQFITRRGDEIVRDVIRTHGLLPDRERAPDEDPERAQQNEEELVAFAQRVFGLAAEAIFQSFVADADQAHRASPSGEPSQLGNDTPRDKGKAPDSHNTASNPPDQTSGETPRITQTPPAFSTPSAAQTMPSGILRNQGTSEVEDNDLTTFTLMRYWDAQSSSGAIQPMTTTPPVLHVPSLPSIEMASNQGGHQARGEGIAEGSNSFRGGGSDNIEISLDEDLLKTTECSFEFWDLTFGPGNSDSGTNPPPR